MIVHNTLETRRTTWARISVLPLITAATAGLLAMLALVQMYRAVALMLTPIEAMYGEAIIYDQAARIVRGEALYQPLSAPPYAVAAYTPVFYYLAAGLQLVLGPGFGPGRAVSLLAAVLVAALVYRLTIQRTGDRAAGMFAALAFLGLGIPGAAPWHGLYKEDLLGVLFGLGAVTVLSDRYSWKRCVVSGLLAALAILTKQTHVAAMFVIGLWLLRYHRVGGLIFGLTAGAIIGAVSLAFELGTGAFLANTVYANVNPFSVQALTENLRTLGGYQGIPMILAGIYVLRLRDPNAPREQSLLGWFWVGSALPLVGLAKVGSNHNYWIELAAATAVLATAGLWTVLRQGGHVRPNAFSSREHWGRFALPILLPVVLASVGLVRAGSMVPSTEGLPEVVQLVRQEPGEVLAVPLDVLALANRPILLEPYLFSILEQEGRWDSGELVRRIESGQVRLVVTDLPLTLSGPSYHGYAHWPESVLASVRAHMTLHAVHGRYYVYRSTISQPE